MDSDMWSRVPAPSRRHQQQFDVLLGFDEAESGSEEEAKMEFSCPYCAEEFDIVGLCCHLDDEHQVEATSGICPICADYVGMDLVGHITLKHASFLKIEKRRKNRRGSSGSHSTLSLLRKNLRDGNLQSLFGGSSYSVPQTSTAADPLLSSFINNLSAAELQNDVQREFVDEKEAESKPSEEKAVESSEPALPEEDKQERTRRSHFVQELVWSVMFDNIS